MTYLKIAACLLLAGSALAEEPMLTCRSQTLQGIPGEPLRLELIAETTTAEPLSLRIPSASNLIVRAVEKIPINRTKQNTFIQKRIVIWQGTAAGTATLTNLTAAFSNSEATFPSVNICIKPVTPAEPPKKPEPEETE